jgi:hypothetical protein
MIFINFLTELKTQSELEFWDKLLGHNLPISSLDKV